MKRFAIAVLACGLSTLFLIQPANAGGSGTITGAAVLDCTITIPSYGTPHLTKDANCSGTATGALAGVAGDLTPYTSVGQGAFNTAVAYDELCVAGEPALVASANGNAFLTLSVNGGTNNGTLTVPFVWTRVGLTAVIIAGKAEGAVAGIVPFAKNDGNKTLTWTDATGTHTANDVVGGAGVAAFVPNTVPACGSPLVPHIVAADVEIA